MFAGNGFVQVPPNPSIRLGQVSRARMSQIMNLTCLVPDIQEEILFLPRTRKGRDAIKLVDLQPIALEPGWQRQRELWDRLHAAPTMVKA